MTPYEILNIKESASDKEIKKAYRALIKKHHPDINPGLDAQVKTQLIIEAYSTIIGNNNIVKNKPETYSPMDFFSEKFVCDRCKGSGFEEKIICDECMGFGIYQKPVKKQKQIKIIRSNFRNFKCSKCKGNGYNPPEICEKCQGFGVIKG